MSLYGLLIFTNNAVFICKKHKVSDIMNKSNLLAFVLFILIITQSNLVNGIPAFSRKYKTSCVTCHSVFPQLTPFGEAFRINGYQFPTDDEEKTKEEPVMMGSEGYKKVWPQSVWPNFIPGSAPIALRGRTGFKMATVDHSSFAEFGRPAVQLLAAGAVGKDITLFAGAHLFEDGNTGSVDRLFLKLDNILSNVLPEKALYVQIGQFIPELVPFASNHRGLTESAYAMNTYNPAFGSGFAAGHSHGASSGEHSQSSSTVPFGIEQFQLGVEASGVIKSRLRYVAGIVNGSGTLEDVNGEKDFYGRLAYKVGGLGFDGTSKDSIGNNGERSFTLGVFGYKGVGADTAHVNYDFLRAGCDVNVYFNKFNLVGGFILGSGGMNKEQEYTLFFGEINYAVFPWLVSVLRYEQANPHHGSSVKQIIPHFSALLVPNVKFKIETRLNPDHVEFDNMFVGLDFAF